ncbi:MAG: uracil phosphoribosyltransferase [Ruminococcaceae bacterium]|jgi:uracil phosphoribosyltransferase|nr:uracil phosphoribosyltransferase [Oscillospiraceae bacterium]
MQYKNAFVFEHPLIQHKISLLRDKNTGTKEFRELVEEVSMLMVYEFTRELPLEEIEIETPLTKTVTKVLSDKPIALVPILRAGLGMVAGIQNLLPKTRVGHIGLYRDHETHQPVEYYSKMPQDIASSVAIILDPMFATGGSAVAAVDYLKGLGCTDIKLVCIIASKYAIDRMSEEHPDVPVFCAAVDAEMNEDMYIVPGLGDAGDRIFGTK